jgi:NitT/TauT family transport system substrate-binding protein
VNYRSSGGSASRRTTRRFTAVVVAMIGIPVAVGLAGPATVAAASPALTSVTIAQGTSSVIWSPIYVAEANGYFKKNGLNVTTQVTGSTTAVSAVLSGSAAAAATGMADSFASATQGKPIVAFASSAVLDSDDIVVTKAFAKKTGLTVKSSLAKKVKALKGATIGISQPGASTQQVIEWLLPQYGLTSKDVSFVAVGSATTALGAMEHGEIDALILDPPGPQDVLQQGIAVPWIRTSQGEIKPGYWVGLLTSSSYISSHRSVVAGLAKSMQEALNFIHAHPQQAKAIVQKSFPSIAPSTFASVWTAVYPAFPKTIVVTKTQVANVKSFMKVTGTPPPTQSFSQLASAAISQQASGS